MSIVIGRVGQQHGSRPLLVGEANPWHADPRFALWPEPDNASGARLARILDMTPREYLKRFDRVNLCEGSWLLSEARRAAQFISATREGVIVLLGAKVCLAFRRPYEPFTANERFAVLPHPSGLNRVWNFSHSAERAQALVNSLT